MDPAFEARLKAIFDEFDDDGGGEIDTEELGQVMEKLGQHCTEAELHVRPLSASVLSLHPRPFHPNPAPAASDRRTATERPTRVSLADCFLCAGYG
eukprot:COSAG06_NODE_6645_length_2841_cov_3.562728_2_plen_96_part_00